MKKGEIFPRWPTLLASSVGQRPLATKKLLKVKMRRLPDIAVYGSQHVRPDRRAW